ncbi:MAG: DUF302 domain-containing protein [Cyanobacteria bacterium J06600_6]
MNNSLKFSLLSLFVFVGGCSRSQATPDNPVEVESVAIAEREADRGLVTVESIYSVAETGDRLEEIIADKGLTMFTRIDHSANAKQAELELQPTQLIIFGNPKVGTPLMNCSATTAIDLPQKFLVTEDDQQQTQIIYNSPAYLQQRHNISGCDEPLAKVAGVLSGIAEAAAKLAK